MSKYYKIAVDVMGSDKGPEMMLRGVKKALDTHSALSVLLVGDESVISPIARELGLEGDRVELLHASDVITNFDSPAAAIFGKPSMR